MGHVLRQIGQQYRHVKADFAGWLLEAVGELLTVDHLILIRLGARKQELDFWTSELLLAVHGLLEVLLGDEATGISDVVLEGLRAHYVLEFQEHVEELEDHLNVG